MCESVLGFLALTDPYARAKRAARLTEPQALAVARAAGERVPDIATLEFAALQRDSGHLIWIFSTTSRGSQWIVKVRDTDGAVMSKGRVGIR